MQLYGKVIKTFPDDRVVTINFQGKIYYLYMTRKTFKDFGPYFYNKPYIFVEASEKKKRINNYYAHEILAFVKVVSPTAYGRSIYFDTVQIRQGVKKVVNKIKNKMFLDLEFTLPQYSHNGPHVPEIVQYGIVLENAQGDIIFEDSSLVKPSNKHALNNRTLGFLSRERIEFNNACNYHTFYNTLSFCLKKYNPKILAWGKSDLLALEQSFKTNNVKPLDVKSRYINLMQVIKNYYNLKEEMGLFQTYTQMAGVELDEQMHDALDDAIVTREIFRMFKTIVNSSAKYD